MSWREQYQPGSFRGAPFRTESHELNGGRRVASFEFPGRDEPLTEDLGRRQRQFSIDCHVVGADYRAARDALVEALEAPGPGLLVHPWHGQMMVVVNDYTSSESTDEGGICRFQIGFAEAGQPVAAPAATSAGTEAAHEAERQKDAAPEKFARKFSIEDAAGWLEENSAKLIEGMTEASQLVAGLQGGAGPALRAFEAGLRFLPDNMSALLRSPLNLAHAVIGMVGAVALLGQNGRARIAGLLRLVDWTPSTPVLPELTPSRQRDAVNREALLGLFRGAAAGELVQAAAAMNFASYEDAAAVRDAVADRLDRLAIEQADRGDDEAAELFDRLRRAMVRDIAVRGATLARIYRLELGASEPALGIAARIYGAAGVEARAAEIVQRNRLVHPGFVPGGKPIELLTASGSGLERAA